MQNTIRNHDLFHKANFKASIEHTELGTISFDGKKKADGIHNIPYDLLIK